MEPCDWRIWFPHKYWFRGCPCRMACVAWGDPEVPVTTGLHHCVVTDAIVFCIKFQYSRHLIFVSCFRLLLHTYTSDCQCSQTSDLWVLYHCTAVHTVDWYHHLYSFLHHDYSWFHRYLSLWVVNASSFTISTSQHLRKPTLSYLSYCR